MMDTTCHIAGIAFRNPIVMASGTFGFGHEYNRFYPLDRIGGFSGKGLTLHPKSGNEGLRSWETAAGMLNSVGLENPGIPAFLSTEAERWENYDVVRILNLGGSSLEDYERGAALIEEDYKHRQQRGKKAVDMIELNISCPNVKAGGMAYGIQTETARTVVGLVRKATTLPLIVKLSPNAEDIVSMALMCEEEGAEAVSLVNTFSAMKIDIYKRRSVFENSYAGLSGPAIKPIALRMVHQVCQSVHIPVMGLGGISSAEDILEFIMAGAEVVQVGTHNFVDLRAGENLSRDLENLMRQLGISSLKEIRGIV
ncbi:dihydroorotate dehydrogenase [Paenibacillus sp. CAA11]|uniref:dihydroorotate dehydrogenase n=1 Tax=Paenibacillus sp. CAA11 TaxID=1532905 RepID=UPI000D38E51A|nr:dihydroorotate dehydrogenase [Paenibacillus sp. CAA11]AWB46919.1 dihydroorotate dehydrogenase [Paenibacillus sp. CAA11]